MNIIVSKLHTKLNGNSVLMGEGALRWAAEVRKSSGYVHEYLRLQNLLSPWNAFPVGTIFNMEQNYSLLTKQRLLELVPEIITPMTFFPGAIS